MAHRYRSFPRWSSRKSDSGTTGLIRLQFRLVNLQTTHEIWFRDRPNSKDFWTNPLVLHEFDHVRLSADPRLANRFEELVYETKSLTHHFSKSESINNRSVQQVVDDFVQAKFTQINELTSIRYKELDRLTNHGRRQINAETEIAITLAQVDQKAASDSDAINPDES